MIPDPEVGPSKRSGKLKRKTIVVSNSEPVEVEESMAEDEASERGYEEEPEAEEEELEGTQPVFKTEKTRPRYKTTPLRKESTSADKAGESPKGSGQKTPRTPGSRAAATPSDTSAPQHQIRLRPLPDSGTSSGVGKPEAAIR